MKFIKSTLAFVLCLCWAMSLIVVRKFLRLFRPLAPERVDAWRDALYRMGAKGILRFAGIRLEWEGAPPERPYILVCNHMAIFDVFVLAAILGCRYVARADLREWPLLGMVARDLECIFIDRERARDTMRVNEDIREALDANAGLVFFPEGGIPPEGDVRRFHTALFEPAAEMGLPVYTAALGYETPPGGPTAHEGVVWRDPDSLVQHFRNVAGLPWCKARVVFEKEPITAADRRALAEATHQAVWKTFQPLREMQTREDSDETGV